VQVFAIQHVALVGGLSRFFSSPNPSPSPAAHHPADAECGAAAGRHAFCIQARAFALSRLVSFQATTMASKTKIAPPTDCHDQSTPDAL
jgi:hypothetical protein